MSESSVAVREALPDDAEQLLAHVYGICDEPGLCVTVTRDEFTMSVEDERKFVAECAASPNSVFLVAEEAGRIIGLLVAHGGKRRAVQHESVISISVQANSRGKGVGAALMAACVDWAKRSGVVTRLELNVFTRNTSAIRLYERFGFVREGVHPRAVFRDGRYEDNLSMALLL